MNFSTAVSTCIKEKFATIQGRAPRSEYWWFMLFCLLVYFLMPWVLGAVLMALPQSTMQNETTATVLGGIYFVALIIFIVPSLTVQIRRLHDIDKSGWWMLISFIPGIGSLVLFIFACLKGTTGSNRFGADPLNPTLNTASYRQPAPAFPPATAPVSNPNPAPEASQPAPVAAPSVNNSADYMNTGRDVRNDSVNQDRRDG